MNAENIQNIPNITKNKRKRGDNWLDEDKILLKELVKERVKNIENKNTDTNTNQQKKKAWEDLEDCFNNLCHGAKRNIGQLKSQWTLTKVVAKKEKANHRREVLKTGGGPQHPETSLSANDISVWLPNEFVVDYNEFDSDDVREIAEQVAEEFEIEPEVVIEVAPNDFAIPQKEKEFKQQGSSEETVCDEFVQKESEAAPDIQVLTHTNISNKGQQTKRRHEIKTNVADEKIRNIADLDNQCRKELHDIQMENEKKKSRLLEKKYELVETKINFYKKRTIDLIANEDTK